MSATVDGSNASSFGEEAYEHDIVAFRASTRRWLVGSFAGWLVLLLLPAGLGLALLLVRWAHNSSTRYRLTNQRLIVSKGIIFKRIDEIELYRVKDVSVDYSVLNQMVNIGDLTLRSSDATTRGRAFRMSDVPDARQIREQLRTLVEQARRQRRVREVDVDRDEFS